MGYQHISCDIMTPITENDDKFSFDIFNDNHSNSVDLDSEKSFTCNTMPECTILGTGITKEMRDRNMFHHMEVPSMETSSKNLRFRNTDSIRTEGSDAVSGEYKELETAFCELTSKYNGMQLKMDDYMKQIEALKAKNDEFREELECGDKDGAMALLKKKLREREEENCEYLECIESLKIEIEILKKSNGNLQKKIDIYEIKGKVTNE